MKVEDLTFKIVNKKFLISNDLNEPIIFHNWEFNNDMFTIFSENLINPTFIYKGLICTIDELQEKIKDL